MDNKVLCKFDKKVIISIFCGQVLSLFICGTAISSAYLSQFGANIPITQSFLNYMLISLTYGMFFAYKSSLNLMEIIKDRGYLYVIAAIIDVEANYLIVKSYQYTNVTSIQLLDCLTIPTVFILSIFILRIRYLWTHLSGVVLCLLGSTGMVLIDYWVRDSSSVSSLNPLLGDILVIIGAILYGISNIIQNYLVKKHSTIEYLGFIGILCSLVSGIQLILIERHDAFLAFNANYANPVFWSCLLGFALSMFLLYSLMPYMMRISDAVITNLSLLTSDMYALIVGIFLFGYVFHPLYFVAYSIIMIGVGMYVAKDHAKRKENEGICSMFDCKKDSNNSDTV
uniref:Slc35f-2 n=1 Tax=Schmidtea mediterranea TaxID=79327 RepID=A0A0H3YFK2_SCHMD|nr:slc35f-2 [Schmidtea mediterranea]